jgi:SAM-dependent methyltransferase
MDANRDQTAHWNGVAGRNWVDAEGLIDRMMKPLEVLIVDAVVPGKPTTVLDVGCGTGAVTVALARRLGQESRVTAIDISEPMLAGAQARAAREGVAASFIRGSAETHPFDPGAYDMIVSRFGVMFFDDDIRAFRNLRRATKPGGRLCFLAWRSSSQNPFITVAERAAIPLLPNLATRKPEGPGPFNLADPDRLDGILRDSGWSGIGLRPVDVTCSFSEKDLVQYVTRLGPIGQIFADLDEPTRAKVIETVVPAFAPFLEGGEVRHTAAVWMATAQAD